MTDHLPECMTPDDPCADPDSCDSLTCSRERLHLTLRDEADQREGGHLPECRYYPQQSIVGDVGCICKALRACEQRVRDQYLAKWEIEYLVNDERSKGYAAGVQAARDAVAALRGVGSFVDGVGNVVSRTAALAAIDALRGEA